MKRGSRRCDSKFSAEAYKYPVSNQLNLQDFIQLFLSSTKSCHMKLDHPVNFDISL